MKMKVKTVYLIFLRRALQLQKRTPVLNAGTGCY